LKYALLTTLYASDDRNPRLFYNNGGRPILSEDKFIFSSTMTSKIIGKQRTHSYTYLIIITSEMIFIVFSANLFQAIFEK
jgi:hypothetical protein